MVNMLKLSVQDSIHPDRVPGGNVGTTPVTTPKSNSASPTVYQALSTKNHRFTINGITLGKTTIEKAKRLAYKCVNWKDGCKTTATRDRLTFWDHNCNGIFGIDSLRYPTQP